MSLELIVMSIVLAAVSGVPGLCIKRTSALGQRLATGIMIISAMLGLAGASLGLSSSPSDDLLFRWPAIHNATLGVDALSAFFLIPIFLISGLGSIYGNGYWPQIRHARNARQLQLFWGFMAAGLSLLVVSRHALAFLFGWEVMALSSFFLVTLEDHREECRRAGWLYLFATHVGTLALFAAFALWRSATGSYALQPVSTDMISLTLMNVLFFLLLISFGIKAGMMPFHFWLPSAHASAPSHVSAMMSGVVIKMGIYGLVRFLSLLPDPPYIWGSLILSLGAVSGLLGVVFAIGQHDLKKLLAYHSVENIGIILIGLGLAMLGRSGDRPEWIVLGLAGCLLHTWNHGLFKSLLFLGAGSVIHGTGTRQIDHLGGLAKTMPFTAMMFLVGAVAICGLPPLNGFVSELFVYLGLLGTITANQATTASVLAVPVLAMTGALALACFVKVYFAVFLGTPRTSAPTRAHESSVTMRFSMLVLAACCFAIGLAPVLLIPVLDVVRASWISKPDLSLMSAGDIVPLKTISIISVSLVVLILSIGIAVKRGIRITRRVVTWDCGYVRSTGRMQYTASSFARTIMIMFGWMLRPRMHWPFLQGLFPRSSKMDSHVDDLVLDRVLLPAGRVAERWSNWCHRFQQGITQQYLLYIVIAVILMLSTIIPFREFIAVLFAR